MMAMPLVSTTMIVQGRTAATRGEAPTVLVVDDEPDIVLSLCGLIEDELPEVQTIGAHSAADGLARLGETGADLVVSDFRMPGMDGVAFIREVERRWPDTHTILVTAFADGDVAARASKETKVDAFLAKPVDVDRFMRLVRTILDGR